MCMTLRRPGIKSCLLLLIQKFFTSIQMQEIVGRVESKKDHGNGKKEDGSTNCSYTVQFLWCQIVLKFVVS